MGYGVRVLGSVTTCHAPALGLQGRLIQRRDLWGEANLPSVSVLEVMQHIQCAVLVKAFPCHISLVSRQYRQVALQVFYGQNRFRVPWTANHPSSDQGNRHLEHPTIWSLPTVSFPFLRTLILEITSHDVEDALADPEIWQQWVQSFTMLASNANIPALNVEIRMKEPFWHGPSERRSNYMDAGYEARMRENYAKFCEPVSILRGMKALFIWMNWETNYGPVDGRQEQEQALEVLVVGEEGYDSSKLGKAELLPRNFPLEAMGFA